MRSIFCDRSLFCKNGAVLLCVPLFCALILGFSAASYAGWNSSGGELTEYSDANNPWYMENTPIINYCILIDEVNFGISKEQARISFHRAYDYWSQNFAHAEYTTEGAYARQFPKIKLATQILSEVSCVDADLILQLGILSQQQVDYLKDPSRYVGVTVRTDYDPENMKGKGFIYISPESGELSLPTNLNIVNNRWSYKNGKLLEIVMVHELGHIFGLAHSEDGVDVMAKDLPEAIISFPGAQLLKHNAKIPDMFLFENDEIVRFFQYYGRKDSNEILGFPSVSHHDFFNMRVWGHSHMGLLDQKKNPGQVVANFEVNYQPPAVYDYETLIKVYISPEAGHLFPSSKIPARGAIVDMEFVSAIETSKVFVNSIGGITRQTKISIGRDRLVGDVVDAQGQVWPALFWATKWHLDIDAIQGSTLTARDLPIFVKKLMNIK